MRALHDDAKHTLTITRSFNATRSRVWKAWTDATLLDLWWGPRPWNAITKSLDFSEGGKWLYCMTGPEGEQHWGKLAYLKIDAENSITSSDSFCDAAGETNSALPSTRWTTRFIDHISWTEVIVTLNFDSLQAMQTIIAMGFEAGFTAGLNQLQEVLEKPKPNNKRVSWKIQIAAGREKVWATTFDKTAYAQWTAAFHEGSYYVGEWQEGQILRFLAGGKDGGEVSGMLSVVREFRAPEFSSLEHLGIVVHGKDDTSSDQALAWAPAFENYTLKANAHGTEFVVEMDLAQEYQSMFGTTWPRALQILKQLCEQ